jgi:hypothetical protein
MATEMVTTEQMVSAARTVEREWGECGYRIGVEVSFFSVAVFEVRAGDGSEFHLAADRYGQVVLLPEDRDYRNHLSGLDKLVAVKAAVSMLGQVA